MKLSVGDKVTLSKAFTSKDLHSFASLSEDYNPVHLDIAYAKIFGFSTTIVHGILCSSLLSALIGTKLPGEGSIYLEQNLKFLAPIFVDELITAEVEITNVRSDKPVISLKTRVFKENNEIAIQGDAVVLYKGIKNV